MALPWDLPLADWSAETVPLRTLDVGPSRHLVRFVDIDGRTYALKELPSRVATREFDVLRRMEDLELPAVRAVGLSTDEAAGTSILVTDFLAQSLQYRRLLARFPLGPNPHRSKLLDAMAWLLVDLHRNGIYWGDCSLANTLFRRDGPKIQAYLVDAETSESHATLSDGQRTNDLDVLVENVAFGLADLALQQGAEDVDDSIAAAEGVRSTYEQVWSELMSEPELAPGDRHAVDARIRRLNDLGFAVDEVELVPSSRQGRLRVRLTVTNRRFHAHELERRTGIVALEEQARLLLNDLREYRAWLEYDEQRAVTRPEAAARWQREVLRPRLAQLAPVIGPDRDALQAYCDVLEHKWLLSERAGRDVGLEAAIQSYLALGAPGPESAPNAGLAGAD